MLGIRFKRQLIWGAVVAWGFVLGLTVCPYLCQANQAKVVAQHKCCPNVETSTSSNQGKETHLCCNSALNSLFPGYSNFDSSPDISRPLLALVTLAINDSIPGKSFSLFHDPPGNPSEATYLLESRLIV